MGWYKSRIIKPLTQRPTLKLYTLVQTFARSLTDLIGKYMYVSSLMDFRYLTFQRLAAYISPTMKLALVLSQTGSASPYAPVRRLHTLVIIIVVLCNFVYQNFIHTLSYYVVTV